MREIALDTETTGLSPASGDRIVEIGCVELINHMPSGAEFQVYINPERDIPERAREVHGLSLEFLSQHQVFSEVADPFLEFIADAPLIIHNAEFDLGFLNAELGRLDRPLLASTRAIDTMYLARQRFPGAKASLDALCQRFEIDLSTRGQHGALIDARLLSAVYLELIGGRQPGLVLGVERAKGGAAAQTMTREPRPHAPTNEELAAHEAFIATLHKPLWQG
jgi:DNA polymerase-3 subunit epsilon